VPGGDLLRWQDYLWLLLLSGSYLLYFLFNRKRRRRKKPRQWVDRPLTRREQKAWHKLQAGGYRLTEIHPALPVTMTVDGKKKSFVYEGNFIVSRDGESFLVKVIKGEGPLHWPGLRRDLLLDCLFFQTDGIFFYLEAQEKMQEIRFSFQSEPGKKERYLWQAALILLITIGFVFLGRLLKGGIF